VGAYFPNAQGPCILCGGPGGGARPGCYGGCYGCPRAFRSWSRSFAFGLQIGRGTSSLGSPPVRCAVSAARALLDRAKDGLCGGRAAARCARVQSNGGGGVLAMASGTVLFDTVAISDTEAAVRARRAGCAVGAGVGRLQQVWLRRLCVGLRRRRGAHCGWGRHVQGRLDLEHQCGELAPRTSCASRRHGMVCYARCGTAGSSRARCGARMLRQVVYGERRTARVARPRAVVWYVARCGSADGRRARCGARMLRRVVHGACGRI
jgi:hypothetical protein